MVDIFNPLPNVDLVCEPKNSALSGSDYRQPWLWLKACRKCWAEHKRKSNKCKQKQSQVTEKKTSKEQNTKTKKHMTKFSVDYSNKESVSQPWECEC